MNKALRFGSGYRTHIIALGLVLNALTPFLTGDVALVDVDFRALLEGLGLSTLRAGMA